MAEHLFGGRSPEQGWQVVAAAAAAAGEEGRVQPAVADPASVRLAELQNLDQDVMVKGQKNRLVRREAEAEREIKSE